jgi:hypothetical protein
MAKKKKAAASAATKAATARKKVARRASKEKAAKRPPRKGAKAARNSRKKTPKRASRARRAFRVRVRMYRHGLGDCFLVSVAVKNDRPRHLLVDCGVLKGTTEPAAIMKKVMEDVEKTIQEDAHGRLDVVIATHEHWDHLSGFHQAREVFDRLDIGQVWMPWTENPRDSLAKELGAARANLAKLVQKALVAHPNAAACDALAGLVDFTGLGAAGGNTTADALEYLRKRGRAADGLHYLKPGDGPLEVPGADGVRLYVLGPPRDEKLLGRSEITKQMKEDGIVFELRAGLPAIACSLDAALSSESQHDDDRYHPFSEEHRIGRDSPYFDAIRPFIEMTYEAPELQWQRIDEDWLGTIEQLALKLDNDTNNTSLVLAMELADREEVLLFAADAQVGNWQSWEKVDFKVDGRPQRVAAHDLVRRTVFYKVGHHGSHNATLKRGGLELMERDDLVAFIPVDKSIAAKQGRKDKITGKPKGWQMPAKGLFKALKERTAGRVVLSDAKEALSPEAAAAGVVANGLYVQYTL